MASYRVRETFFRPEREVARESSTLPADLVNALRRLLTRGVAGKNGDHVFLPIRSMQYQAIVAHDEVIFVDALGGYAQQDGEGGRLISIAWRPAVAGRDSLAAPVPCDIVYYFGGLKEVQRRLVGETRGAVQQALARRAEGLSRPPERRVIPFRAT